jgi:alkylated DNA repair protein alkB family protein 8
MQKDFIRPETEDSIIQWLDQQKWSNALSRRTQHYGYEYRYNTSDLKIGHPFNGLIEDMRLLLLEKKIMDQIDQCIVNEYTQSQGIGKHIDRCDIFGSTIVSYPLEMIQI